MNLGAPDSDKAVLGGGVLWHFHDNFYALGASQSRERRGWRSFNTETTNRKENVEVTSD